MIKKWKLVTSEKVFETKYLNIEKRSYELPTGKLVEDYYHINRSNYVLIIARNKKGEILLEKNYRRGVDEILIELPAGWVEKDEDPISAALRELKEETGFTGKARLLGEIYPQPAFMGQCAYVILIELGKTISMKDLDEDENTEISFVNLNLLDEMIKKGEIKDMGLLCALKVLRESER